MIKKLALLNRSYRKYINNVKINLETLTDLIEAARIAPSSKNQQPLKYILLTKENDTNFVFKHLRWAWYLKDWDGPAENERPPAYIIMCCDTDLNDQALIDAGISAQTILLSAVEKGLGGCIIRTVNRYAIAKYFNLPSNLDIIQVLAIGVPDQKVELTTPDENGSIEYYEDKDGIHYVPKRKLEDIIIIP